MLNLFVKQWDVVKCCKHVVRGTFHQRNISISSVNFQGVGSCLESSLGIIQTFVQWFLFTIMYGTLDFWRSSPSDASATDSCCI